tara:strand:+ start:1261 stop:1674 length:414 start_codon:yes stop_codon:yes gene_type:complete
MGDEYSHIISAWTPIIQAAQDSLQFSEETYYSAISIRSSVNDINDNVDSISESTYRTELDIVELRNDISLLSETISNLEISINNSMVPTVDNSIIKIIIVVFSAFTICIVVCQLLVALTSKSEIKRSNRRVCNSDLV